MTVASTPTADAERLKRLPELMSVGRFSEIEALLLAHDVRLRALLPRGPETQVGAEVVAQRMRDWFDRPAIRLESCCVEPVGDRWALAYRMLVGAGAERTAVEQHCICEVDDGRIRMIDLVCSGFRPFPEDVSDVVGQRFDAETLGCADGLAQAFRDRMASVPLSGLLEVTTADPAAREDLPPMARMLGHAVLSIEPRPDGRTTIVVQRGK